MRRRLYRSRTDRRLFGVCGGLAAFLKIDSTIVRLIWAILVFCYGTGLAAYIIAALVIPNEY